MLPVSRVIGHREWTTRKIDPRYSMDWRRAGVAHITPRGAPPHSDTRRRSSPTEDQTMYLRTVHPKDWKAPKKDWPAEWVSFGFDPPGGWGGIGILKITTSAPGGWIREATWWRRHGTGLGRPNEPHDPIAITPIPGGPERFQGLQLEIPIPARCDELELLIAAPGGVHLAAYYQN